MNNIRTISTNCTVKQRHVIASELKRYRSELRKNNADIRAMEKHATWPVLWAILFDWTIILAAWWLVISTSPFCLVISALIVGNRQRAIGNLLHDGSHHLLAQKPRINELLTNLALAPPLLTMLKYYKRQHDAHHLYLGEMDDDPDFIHDDSYRNMSWQRIFLLNSLSVADWKGNVFGSLAQMSWRHRAMVALWWLVLFAFLTAASGLSGAGMFLILWFTAKTTVFHLLTTFREISDHAGLNPNSLTGFTRSHPTRGLLKSFIHPHNNGYHLAHHILPSVPFWRLPEAHRILMEISSYANGHHCDAYFVGSHSAVACWTGSCSSRRQT